MASQIRMHWWGYEVCMDESTTKDYLNIVDTGATVSGVAAIFSGVDEKIIIGLVTAAEKLESTIIKAVDQHGGSNGVCIYQLWVGLHVWMKPRVP
jgi:hypothetical protein